MSEFSALLASIHQEDEAFSVTLPESWLQGRTAYGGLTAALCVECALRAVPDVPPLRSAQFALIGPAAGPLAITVQLLRRGKSSAFLEVDLTGEAGLAAHAILTFGTARNSVLRYQNLPMPAAKPIENSPSFFPDKPMINFQQHFESRMAGGARPFAPDADPEYLIWFRHRDPKSHKGLVPLIALADAPPPASMVIFPKPAPISTMTWSMDILSDNPQTRDGWWLVESKTETAHQGYSTQSMMVWNTDGQPVIAHRQNVAIFI
jgi:acyl-CoA thioesterase